VISRAETVDSSRTDVLVHDTRQTTKPLMRRQDPKTRRRRRAFLTQIDGVHLALDLNDARFAAKNADSLADLGLVDDNGIVVLVVFLQRPKRTRKPAVTPRTEPNREKKPTTSHLLPSSTVLGGFF
jgi:hypothetical protein